MRILTLKTIYVMLLLILSSISYGEKDNSSTGQNPIYYGLTFVSIPGGTFRMGDIQNYGRYSCEKPVHDVTISSFEMSIYEVTNAQYASFLTEALASGDIKASSSSVSGTSGAWSDKGYLNVESDYCNISYSNGKFSVKSGKEDHPIKEVTWYGSKAFAEYYGLDLPTEAEWEYACRAGTETKFYTGNNLGSDGETSTDLDKAGWYWDNSDTGEEYLWTHPVGQKEPNVWGLYDMHGNVWEWCNDWFDSCYYTSSPSSNPTGPSSCSCRVSRGGGGTASPGPAGRQAATGNTLGTRATTWVSV